LGSVLSQLPQIEDPNVLVGFNTADDAGVVKLTEDLALIQTVDIFTPVVDDPYTYGAVVAANSLSDVYAMGGKPICALNIMGFPQGKFDLSVMVDILKGAYDKAKEARTYYQRQRDEIRTVGVRISPSGENRHQRQCAAGR